MTFISILLLAMLIYLIYSLFNSIKIDFLDFGFWAVILSIFIISYVLYLLPNDFEEIKVNEKGIFIRNIVRKKTTFIGFEDIIKHYVQRSSDSGQISDGHIKLILELKNESILILSQNVYANFFELKVFIYEQLDSEL